jgi:hypothetical protein
MLMLAASRVVRRRGGARSNEIWRAVLGESDFCSLPPFLSVQTHLPQQQTLIQLLVSTLVLTPVALLLRSSGGDAAVKTQEWR